jgi:hypothetical protein
MNDVRVIYSHGKGEMNISSSNFSNCNNNRSGGVIFKNGSETILICLSILSSSWSNNSGGYIKMSGSVKCSFISGLFES